MLRLAADENFNGRIVRALKRQIPELDIVRAQDNLPEGTDDIALLAWAAEENRVVLSHDIATLVGYANERLKRFEPMPGLVVTPTSAPIGAVLQDLELLILTSTHEDLDRQVLFLPL